MDKNQKVSATFAGYDIQKAGNFISGCHMYNPQSQCFSQVGKVQPALIEVTPEMINDGAAELERYDWPNEHPKDAVVRIFVAMVLAARR